MERLRHGPGHPLCLSATALLLLNDHVLKRAWPGLVTGKLSDVCWLVVAPVVVAAVLAWAPLPARAVRVASLGGVAVAYTVLQLWPPLGDAWTAVLGGAHVADAADLLALPALALAPLCWRPARRRRWALVVAAGACVATTESFQPVYRLPCDGAEDWDPNRPLVLGWGGATVPRETESFYRGLALWDEHGAEVPFVVSGSGADAVLCPLGGLEADAVYTWMAGPWEDDPSNELEVPGASWEGVWSFRTARASELEPVHHADYCRAVGGHEFDDDPGADPCVAHDTGDSGWD